MNLTFTALTGGPLKGTHKLASFHFHWGKSDAEGSEHKIDGKQYPAEVSIVIQTFLPR